MRINKIYAVYRGDQFLFVGTAQECARYFGVKLETVFFWSTPANKKRATGFKQCGKEVKEKTRKIAIVVEDDEC